MLEVIVDKAKEVYHLCEEVGWYTANNPSFYEQDVLAHFLWFAAAARLLTIPFAKVNDRIEQHNLRPLNKHRHKIPEYIVIPAALIAFTTYRDNFSLLHNNTDEVFDWLSSSLGSVYGVCSKDIHGFLKEKLGGLKSKLFPVVEEAMPSE